MLNLNITILPWRNHGKHYYQIQMCVFLFKEMTKRQRKAKKILLQMTVGFVFKIDDRIKINAFLSNYNQAC